MKKFLPFLFLFFLISCQHHPTVHIANKTLFVELADTPEKRSTGLMFRTHLDENTGMLFIFTNEQKRSFWMKNTLLPLDMIFIDSNLKIVDIHTAFPCTEKCIPYTSQEKAMYVLEVNKGFSETNNLQIGNTIHISK